MAGREPTFDRARGSSATSCCSGGSGREQCSTRGHGRSRDGGRAAPRAREHRVAFEDDGGAAGFAPTARVVSAFDLPVDPQAQVEIEEVLDSLALSEELCEAVPGRYTVMARIVVDVAGYQLGGQPSW